MPEVGVVEAWRRFGQGNAGKAEFQIILADLMELTLRGMSTSFDVFLSERKSLDNYSLYCALVAAKQEIGNAIVGRLNFTEDEIIEARRLARASIKRGVFD